MVKRAVIAILCAVMVVACSADVETVREVGDADPVLVEVEGDPIGEAEQNLWPLWCSQVVNGSLQWIPPGEKSTKPPISCAVWRCDSLHDVYLDASACGPGSCTEFDWPSSGGSCDVVQCNPDGSAFLVNVPYGATCPDDLGTCWSGACG